MFQTDLLDMEGMLWKWTNYFSGWQPRWFVLDQGILSYYRSQDDVINGCKGSIKMSVCDVLVHPNDATRLDLIIPSEAHFYVKAATPQERQQWLVALGSSKACLNNCLPIPSSPTTEDDLPAMPLKTKKSELRLYCDLLMQQVHSVKCAVDGKDQPDIEQLKESTSLLSATCDTFIRTLEECLQLAHANIDASFSAASATKKESLSPTSMLSRSLSKSKTSPWPPMSSSVQRSTSADNYRRQTCFRQMSSPVAGEMVVGYVTSTRSLSAGGSKKTSSTSSESFEQGAASSEASPASPGAQLTHRDDPVAYLGQNGRSVVEEVDGHEHSFKGNDSPTIEIRLQTFLTKIDASFIDIRLTSDLEIPTVPFLDACRSILPIFDRLNQTAFAPARLDIASNIKRIHQKYLSSPEAFISLQKIILFEVQSRQSHMSTSATRAILWLNRTLEFIHEVAVGFLSSVDDMSSVVSSAYSKTLEDYHSWVLRSAFRMGIKAVPSRSEFIRCLALDESHVNHPSFITSLQHDIEDHDMALTTVTQLLHDFLRRNDLDFPEQV